KNRTLYGIMVGFLSAAVALHQNYVNFFKHPIIPLHLNYIFDLQFLQANSRDALVDRYVLLIFFLGTLVGHFLFKPLPKLSSPSWKKKLALYLGLLCLASAAHILHNRYKEQ